ncbi:hypothetical protein TW95_gp0167 [Pandoravirus inopinatum]|uniref:Uncharacterized protein n=1 Tax=Pandoravirus inopinatum TaxID=1605721 RepID=A0A0B5J7Z0_9VIRU|nr:hypothetical protein TW95_gp0167 [Pandoravirus inopinatum]AJF96901.1 hypothetical protein [Pandoravirus inopinatum]
MAIKIRKEKVGILSLRPSTLFFLLVPLWSRHADAEEERHFFVCAHADTYLIHAKPGVRCGKKRLATTQPCAHRLLNVCNNNALFFPSFLNESRTGVKVLGEAVRARHFASAATNDPMRLFLPFFGWVTLVFFLLD